MSALQSPSSLSHVQGKVYNTNDRYHKSKFILLKKDWNKKDNQSHVILVVK